MGIFNVEILGSSGQTINIDASSKNPQIYLDDNIQTIKNKIIIALDYKVSYEEIYLFAKGPIKHFDHKTIYKSLIDEDEEFLSSENYDLFLRNYDNNNNQNSEKTVIDYNDFMTFSRDQTQNQLVGNAFKTQNYKFPINPFDCNKKNLFENVLLNLENNVLLDFSQSSTLYVCCAGDVLKELDLTDSEKTKVISIYYPFLFNKGVKNTSDLTKLHIELVDSTKKSISTEVKKVYEMIDAFNHIQEVSPKPFDYNKNNIDYFRFVIHGTSQLPLDAIFKNIHATENVPFIKYSPNIKRDSLYRLYSNGIAKSGRKIPLLNGPEIIKYAKEIGQKDEISMVVKHTYKSKPIKLYLHIRRNGKLCVEGHLTKEIQNMKSTDDYEKITEIMHECLNPTIHDINKYLESFGYSLEVFDSIQNVKFESISHTISLKVNKPPDFSKYRMFLMSLFSYKNQQAGDDKTILYFKKVNNYVEMDPMEDYVLNTYKQTQSLEKVIHGMIHDFGMNESESATKANAILSNYHVINGEIIENSGFPINFHFEKSKNILNITIDQISHIEYIELLKKYIHCLMCLYQREKEVHPSIESVALQKKINFEKIEEKRIAPIDLNKMETIQTDFFEDSENEDDEEMFGMDVDEDEEVYGGERSSNSSSKHSYDVENMRLKRPNPFQSRIEERDPKLILKETQGKFKQYSRSCPVAASRQPVILDDKEKERIDKKHPGSYTTSIKYGSDPANEFWYICPRYWSLKSNNSLTQEEVDKILKTNPKAIIPHQADVVPKGAYIYEFNNPKEHMNDKNEYIPHYPGLQFDAHPDNLGVPCCFKKPHKVQKKEEPVNNQLKNYVIDANKFPIPQDRLGFLPDEVCRYFNFENGRVISKSNPAIIKPNTPCFLRYGCEQNLVQSFLGCCAQIYAEIQGRNVPTIAEFRKIISASIDLDSYIKYLQGSLVSIFRPKSHNISAKDMEKYSSTTFYQFMNMNNKKEVDFLKETIASYENFQKFLDDDKAIIDHTLIWSIMSLPNKDLFPKGIHLYILETGQKDTVRLLCPSVEVVTSTKPTCFLLLQDIYYEIICHYENKNKNVHIDKIFDSTTHNSSIKYVLELSENKSKHCAPRKSLPFIKESIAQNIDVIVTLLNKYQIKISEQIMDFRAYIVGLGVELSSGNLYLPIYPSEYKYNEYETTLINDDTLWQPYDVTKQMLLQLSEKTNGEIMCKPVKKVVKNMKIIGLLTETQQFVRTSDHPRYDEVEDDLEIEYNGDYIDADIQSSFNKEDKERILKSKNVFLETQFYSIFRTTIRLLLDNPLYQKIRSRIQHALAKTDITYEEKMTELYYCFIDLTKDHVQFGNPSVENSEDIHTCFSNVDTKPTCIKEGSKVLLLLPEENLHHTNVSNKMLYYMKLCDEVIRVPTIRSFVIENGNTSMISNLEYSVHDNEILLIEDAIKSDFFNELNIFTYNHENKNITFNIAQPSIHEKYSNKVKV